jgi:hypothetical protein
MASNMLTIKPLDLHDHAVQRALPNAVYMPTNLAYQCEYMTGWSFQDASFAVYDGEDFLAGCCMAAGTGHQGQRTISAFGLPVIFISSKFLQPKHANELHKLTRKKLETIMVAHPGATMIFREYHPENLSSLCVALLDAGCVAQPVYSVVIPLEPPEEILWSRVRKSYKALIHKGEREFQTRLVDTACITLEDIEAFRKLHMEVSGRETRPHASWLKQFEAVKAGEAFIILTYMDDALVGAAYFILSPVRCLYGVGAYQRELFDKPLAHVSLWKAMLEAKSRGCAFFDTGRCHFPFEHVSDKERNIGLFKRGFGGIMQLNLIIHEGK